MGDLDLTSAELARLEPDGLRRLIGSLVAAQAMIVDALRGLALSELEAVSVIHATAEAAKTVAVLDKVRRRDAKPAPRDDET